MKSSSLRKRFLGKKLGKWNSWERKFRNKHLGGRDGEDEFRERNLGGRLGNEIQGRENMELQNWGDIEDK